MNPEASGLSILEHLAAECAVDVLVGQMILTEEVPRHAPEMDILTYGRYSQTTARSTKGTVFSDDSLQHGRYSQTTARSTEGIVRRKLSNFQRLERSQAADSKNPESTVPIIRVRRQLGSFRRLSAYKLSSGSENNIILG